MSYTNIKSHLRSIIDPLGYTEWTDAFDTNNIPEHILDRSYNIQIGNLTSDAINQQSLDISSEFILRVFVVGFRDTSSTLDESLLVSESLLKEILKPVNRLTDNIKNLVFNSATFSPLSETNNNVVVIEFNFTAITFLCFD